MHTITDTIPTNILDSVIRHYADSGYNVKNMLLVSSGLWSVTYEKAA